MGPSPQCYIPSHKVIGPLVLEKKIFEGFLPYMGVAAILVMLPKPREQTFVPPSQWGSIWNLALIGQAVLEKKTFENGGQQKDGRMDGRQWAEHRSWLFYKLTNEPKSSCELKIIFILQQFTGRKCVMLFGAILWSLILPIYHISLR